MPIQTRPSLLATLATATSLVLLAACAGGSAPVTVEGIEPADDAGVAGCRYLDTVTGSSGWYGVNAGLGTDNARREALQQAKAIGANRIVWLVVSPVHGATQVSGKAYKCGA